MVCEKCGKTLTEIGKISENLEIDNLYIINLLKVFEEEYPKLINRLTSEEKLSNEQLYSSLQAIFDLRLKADYLKIKLNKELIKEFNLESEKLNSLHIIDDTVYY